MANTQPLSDPLAITRDTAQNLGLSAADLRDGVGALGPAATGNTFGNRSGTFPGGTTGTGLSNDCQVFSGSGMTSTVNGGHYGVSRGQTFYLGMIRGAVTLTHDASSPTYPRLDIIAVRVRDPGLDPATVTESAKVVIIKGTPAATPSLPALTDGDLALSSVLIRANASSTIVSDYTDLRLPVVARGGIVPRPSWDTRPGSYEGEYADDLNGDGLMRWSGTEWQVVASPAAWKAFTPKLYSDAGEVNLGGGGSAFGRYMVNGKVMHLRYEFRAVRPCNLGYGSISTRLPSGFKSAALRESHIYAKLNTIDTPSLFPGEVFIPPDSNVMWYYFPGSADTSRIASYRVAVSAGTPGQSVPNLPGGYADPAILTCQGTIEIQ